MSQPVAIVTGGASGIGLALTKHLLTLSPPWRVIIADLPTSRGQEWEEVLGPNVCFVPANVSVFSQQRKVFETAYEWGGGRIDFLAANAGIADTAILHQEIEWDGKDPVSEMDVKALDVDLVAVIQGIWLFNHYAVLTRKRLGEGWVGRIILTSSPAGLYCPSTLPLYVAAKAGLIALTYSVAASFAEKDRRGGSILVNAVLPGLVKTGLPPPGFIDKFPSEHITPMETVMRAFDRFLLHGEVSGMVVECSLEKLYEREKGGGTGYVDESTRWIGEESDVIFTEAYETVSPVVP